MIPTLPPRVDYELTELGRSLQEPVTVLSNWAIENLTAIDAARTAYDAEVGGKLAARRQITAGRQTSRDRDSPLYQDELRAGPSTPRT